MRVERRVRRREDIRRWLEGVGAVLLIAALVSALHFCGAEVCLFRRLTGWPCLTCGTSRAFAALLRGDIAGAFAMQPLAVAAGAAVGAAVLIQTFSMWRLRTVLALRLERHERIALAVAAVLLLAANWIWLAIRGV